MANTDSDDDVNDNEDIDDEVRPIEFWEKKQRELVTNQLDYNLNTLSQLIDNKTIDLSPRYQRRFRWDIDRQSKLIESFLMNVPVPPLFLNEDKYGEYSVIDGKQRLTAIHEFMKGRLRLKNLEIFSDINGMCFDDLPGHFQSVIATRPTIRAIIILRQSDKDVKFEVFQRLNTGGVRLNPQEIRNSAYPGPLNDLVLDLSEWSEFHSLLGITDKRKSKLYQEMRDAEFVVRYFTFRKEWETFSGGMKNRLDSFMYENQKPKKALLVEMKSDFENTVRTVHACFGNHAFQRWQPENQTWRKHALASLFDAQMIACRGFTPEQCKPKQKQIIAKVQKLMTTSTFRQTIDSATNTPSFFISRIRIMFEMINEIVG